MLAPAKLSLQARRDPGARGVVPNSGALWDCTSFPLSLLGYQSALEAGGRAPVFPRAGSLQCSHSCELVDKGWD